MRRKILYVLIILIFCSGALSAQTSRRLNEGWEFVKQDLGGAWEAVRPVKAGNPETVPLWSKVTLPHCFNAEDAVDPDVNYYQGPGWYRTMLDIKNPYRQGRTLLHFEGSGQKTEVYIYNVKVAEHVGGYDEWTVDITDAVADFKKTTVYESQFKGKVPVVVRCDNSRDLEMIPSDLSDFNLYGGIYRYLNLVYNPRLAIDKSFAKAEVDEAGKAGKLSLTLRLNNPGEMKHSLLKASLFDPSCKKVADYKGQIGAFDGDSLVWQVAVKSPKLWSPDKPQMYTVKLSLSINGDTYERVERVGFRHFEFVKKGPFMLNGKRLLLRGTHRHEDHAGVAAAMTEDMIRTEMQMMKDMGVNFIRLGHYQQSRIVLDLCDSLGILVWEEIPWCRGGLGGAVYQAQAKRMLTNMIEQHYNHPAIIIWGLGNENDWPNDFPEFDQQKIRAFMTELNTLSHQLDASRSTAIRRCDFCKDIVDVYSPSIWAGWYRGNYTEYKDVSLAEFNKTDRFLHVEWGGDSHARRHSENPDNALSKIRTGGGADERAGDASLYGGAARVSKDGDWSESYISNLIDWHLKEQETMPWLSGAAYWPFKDFSTPVRPENPVPYMNQKGVVERDFTKKEAYYIFQSYWTEKPMVHIYGHSWPVRWGDEGEEKMVKVYSNCDEAELFVNGKSYGVKKRNSQDFPAAGLRWQVPMNRGQYAFKVVAKKGKVSVTDEITQEYESRKWGKPATMSLERIEEQNGVATIEVKVKDGKGVMCLQSSNMVEFSLAGDGALIDNQGTSTGSRKVQLYNGRAVISVKLNGQKSVVAAKAEGLPTAFLELSRSSRLSKTPSYSGESVYEAVEMVLKEDVLKKAERYLDAAPVTVTAQSSSRSAGGKHDFYSEGDYWWPDTKNPEGPYVQRDGLTNPDNFVAHRLAMIRFNEIVGALASAFKITGDEKYAAQALLHLKAWFVNSNTLMNPNLQYAQAIKGITTGRGIGIIDTIHLMEVAQGVLVFEKSKVFDKKTMKAIRNWFSSYLEWLTTSKNGLQEKAAKNNHGTCWVMQVASFAKLVGNEVLLDSCAERYKTVLLPNQMAEDGSFPLELARTKPYGYSIFNLDAMATICQIISTPDRNLWAFETVDGRSIKKGIEYLYPFVVNKNKWPLKPDVMYWNEWPVAQPFLLFGANAYRKGEWLATWEGLEHQPGVEEVVRNLPIRNPLIWM